MLVVAYSDQAHNAHIDYLFLSASKLSVSSVRGSIRELLASCTEKKRNFVETIELQIGLKNYDPQRDKRFSGTIKLPTVPRPNMTIWYVNFADRPILRWNVLMRIIGRRMR